MATDNDLNYIVALDPEAGYCRLFRTDAPEGAGLDPLWAGLGLRKGYDAMIRLNRERRPTEIYRVASRPATRRKTAFRLFKGFPPTADWTVLHETPDREAAKKALSDLVRKRDDDARAETERLLRGLRRAGAAPAALSRITGADRRYIEWLEATGRIAA
jgi:hypothetical protein